MKANAPHYHGHRQRLRQRFLKGGMAALGEHEVIELLLTLAIPRCDVKKPAKALLARFGNLRSILDAPIEHLQEVDGLGTVAPVALRIMRETASLYLQQTAEQKDSFSDPEYLAQFWRMRIGGLSNEVFEVAYLDSGFCLLPDGVERLEEGTVDRATIYPRRVVEAALRRGAAAITLAHNHPNRNLRPSDHDKTLTRAVVLAATTVDLKVLDHLIVSPEGAFSFRREGLL